MPHKEELGQRSFHAGAQTFYFQRKPASESDRWRARAAQGSGPAAGSAPALARVKLAGRIEAPGAAADAAPGPSIVKRSRAAGEDEEDLWYPRPGKDRKEQPPPLLCPACGPASAQRAGARRERRGSQLAEPLCGSSSFVLRWDPAQKSIWYFSAKGASCPPLRNGVNRRGSPTLEAETASEREPGRKTPGRGDPMRAPMEHRA
ncbi:Hypothetical predicted protein [Marmota monax]|uniref:Uncharacterized protein n=1 Tax=Marmota monax TaxID=9995 RepID=A0A5E4AMJ0_MARMO|nr:Hypothetical predicted protein [Marmota monax]